MTEPNCAAIVLAAGKGTRMKSDLPKVLHRVAGRPMILHLLDALDDAEVTRRVVVVAPEMDGVATAVAPSPVAIQAEALGTGHAALAARDSLGDFEGDILVLFGDTPLLGPETVRRMLEARRAGSVLVALGFRPADPAEYGRLMVAGDGGLQSIVEYRDASEEQRAIDLCNAGIMAVDGAVLFSLLEAVGNDNAKAEYYLTDIVAIARARGLPCSVVEVPDPLEVMGVNGRADLAAAEAAMQARLRAGALAGGATLIDPETVWFSADTRIGRDVTIGPCVVFGPGVTIGDSAEIRAFSHIEGAKIEAGAVVGPFARLRPGAEIGRGARIGNFVEIKQALVGKDARIGHLSYVGDARVGERANIGAGTITCNYDGFSKHRTDIGAGAFIGSNAALVAPVTVGDGAVVGAGSVVTVAVGRDALAVARGRQRNLEGWARSFRERKANG